MNTTSTIKAKVVVTAVEDQISFGEVKEKYGENVRMMPVYGNGEENKSYSDATPSGAITLLITNKNAWGFFVEDKEYYVDFNRA